MRSKDQVPNQHTWGFEEQQLGTSQANGIAQTSSNPGWLRKNILVVTNLEALNRPVHGQPEWKQWASNALRHELHAAVWLGDVESVQAMLERRSVEAWFAAAQRTGLNGSEKGD